MTDLPGRGLQSGRAGLPVSSVSGHNSRDLCVFVGIRGRGARPGAPENPLMPIDPKPRPRLADSPPESLSSRSPASVGQVTAPEGLPGVGLSVASLRSRTVGPRPADQSLTHRVISYQEMGPVADSQPESLSSRSPASVGQATAPEGHPGAGLSVPDRQHHALGDCSSRPRVTSVVVW